MNFLQYTFLGYACPSDCGLGTLLYADKMRGEGVQNVSFCPRKGRGVRKWQNSVYVVVEGTILLAKQKNITCSHSQNQFCIDSLLTQVVENAVRVGSKFSEIGIPML